MTYRFRVDAQFHFIKTWHHNRMLHTSRLDAAQEAARIAAEAPRTGLTGLRILPVAVEVVRQCERCKKDINEQGLCGCPEGDEGNPERGGR